MPRPEGRGPVLFLLFSESVYRRAVVLVVGAILAMRARTVTAALRVMGLGSDRRFGTYHRVLSWAKCVWALPFLTALCPSERYHVRQGKRHKKLTDFARDDLSGSALAARAQSRRGC